MAKELLYILIGGGFGSMGRFLISEITPHYYKGNFPIGTLAANIIGCFVIGIFAGLINKDNTLMNALLVTGFCGGFTTFSSFSKESFLLIKNKKINTALIYILSSSVCGILAVWAGFSITGN